MSEPTIKLNPSKPCELEFEVSVQGTDASEPPVVRFVMNGCDEYMCVFECNNLEGNKWQAKLPTLEHFTRTTVPFFVEVIVDGYYFQPAEGTVHLMTDPQVMFSKTASAKPTVATSFTVKQENKKPKKAEEDEQVTAQYAGDMSPTTDLLRPEFEPKQGSVKTAQATKDDEHIDKTRIDDISSHVTPGETTDPEPDKTEPRVHADEGDEEEFDPRRVAESIVKTTLGGVQRPLKRGTLFKRDGDGKPVVEGLETPTSKAEKLIKAAKVKEILGTK